MDCEPITGACDSYAWIHNYFTVLSRPKNSDFFLPYIEIQDSFVNDRGNALVGIIKRFLLLLVLLRHGCPIAVVVSDLVTFLS